MKRDRFLERLDQLRDTTTHDAEISVVVPEGALPGEYAPPFTPNQALELVGKLGLIGFEPVHLGNNLYGGVAIITPEVALDILRKRNEVNRDVTEAHSLRIASDISEEAWVLTHMGIAFRADGELQDGQHRLHAIVESQRAIPVFVALNVCDEAKRVIDSGKSRSAREYVSIRDGAPVSSKHESVVKSAFAGIDSSASKLSRTRIVELIDQHRKALDFVLGGFDTMQMRQLGKTPVLGALVRAFYHEKRDRLREFIEVFTTGIVEDRERDQAAVLLNQAVLRATKTSQRKLYPLTLAAVRAFAQGSKPSRLAPLRKDPYDLPTPTVSSSAESVTEPAEAEAPAG